MGRSAHGVMAAWKSIECCMPIVLAFVSVKWIVSPRCTRTTGAGVVPLNVQTWYLTPSAISWTVSLAMRSTFTTVPLAVSVR